MIQSKIKQKINQNIEMIEEEDQLQMLLDLTDLYAGKTPGDIIDFFSPEQLVKLEKSLQQARIGNTVSHESARQISRQWLGE